ncbi:MAG: hypothetical protein Q9208_000853 [Pyrenodesmia sp. 3 TL-2023]
MLSFSITLLSLLAYHTSAYVLFNRDIQEVDVNETSTSVRLARRDLTDPANFGWIKRWAAIGDSFTAGIGSGKLYSQQKDDRKCSRYDLAYPALANNAFGPAVEDFQFAACSGDRSLQIYDQISAVQGNLDLVMMTAGGNDLCLAGIIRTCIFLPFQGEASCQSIIDKAQENIDTILKPNIKELLLSLNTKMNQDSIVVYNLYAQYFNTETDACEKDQGWAFPKLWFSPLLLTIDRRNKFNTLVRNINQAIDEVVVDINDNGNVKYKIASADWDIWPREGVSGLYCVPESTGRYPDPAQPDLQFFKPDTFVSKDYHDELKKRITPEQEREIRRQMEESTDVHDSLLWKSANPPAEALHQLDRRAPAPPGCPGDTGILSKFNLGLPDAFGKFFHPNELGHQTIASFAVQTVIDTRAKVLGIDNPSCTVSDEFKCWQEDGRRGYANAARMNENYKDFCNKVQAPADTVGWKSNIPPYHPGTPDEHSFSVELTSAASQFDKNECLESFDRIVNGCDGNDPENPMGWKFGGRYVRGEYTYEVNVKRDNRPWPPIKEPRGDCKGWYKVFYSDYKLHGAGWATWDKGEETLRPNIKGCLGLGITAWKFEYYDQPDKDGNEWGLSVNLPIWVRSRCFKNDKVQAASGGSTDGCGGND